MARPKKPEPGVTQAQLVRFAHDLRELVKREKEERQRRLVPLSVDPDVAEFVADAIERGKINPRERGRPKAGNNSWNYSIAERVFYWLRDGKSWKEIPVLIEQLARGGDPAARRLMNTEVVNLSSHLPHILGRYFSAIVASERFQAEMKSYFDARQRRRAAAHRRLEVGRKKRLDAERQKRRDPADV